jgi:endoglucanase
MLRKIISFCIIVSIPVFLLAYEGMSTHRLHVEGRYLKDSHGNTVNLHGVAVTPSPWFNGCHIGECRWEDYDTAGCLAYNNAMIDRLTDTTDGWFLSYIRLHLDPHWTNDPGSYIPESDISCFNFDKLVVMLDRVIIPIIEHAK